MPTHFPRQPGQENIYYYSLNTLGRLVPWRNNTEQSDAHHDEYKIIIEIVFPYYDLQFNALRCLRVWAQI